MSINVFILQLLKSHQAISLQSKEDKFIGSINMQLKLLQTYPLRQENADVSRGFRNTFLVTCSKYNYLTITSLIYRLYILISDLIYI